MRDTEEVLMRAKSILRTETAVLSHWYEGLTAALSATGGRDYAALADNVSGQIGDAIFRAIGREEAEIRRDPAATRDPILMALLR